MIKGHGCGAGIGFLELYLQAFGKYMILRGSATVIKNAGSHYMLSELPSWKPFPAILKGKVRMSGSSSTNPVAVGDRVEWTAEVPEGQGTEAVTTLNPAAISEILDRRNYVIRKSANLSRRSHVIAANIDMAYIVVTLYFPEIKLPFLDRILVMCGVYGVPVTIVLNKIDLYGTEAAEEVADFVQMYRNAGYEVLETSAVTGVGIDRLAEESSGKVCLFSGESGTGKSSLVKALDPSLEPKIGKISVAHLQGRHTTSLYEMYRTSGGAYIIDTPGLRGFGLVSLNKEEISLYFPEMFRVSNDCRFSPCTHTHEPGCAVKEAVDRGEIDPRRYNSYLGMLEEDGKFR